MAENYDLIFGQSASQQYAWSDSDYQNGWQTVGSTPPTAEQFDALQRRNDTKAQDLNNRLSPIEEKSEADGRQAATTYTAGAMLTVDGLPNGWLLQCIVPGISGTDAITLPDTLIDGLIIVDGTVTWALRKVATNGGLGYRQPNTAYAVGQIAYHSALPTGYYLECTTAGTSGSGDLAISILSVGGTVSDGTVTWTVMKNLPLSGGAMTGSIVTNVVDVIKMSSDTNTLRIVGGTSADEKHPFIYLSGNNAPGTDKGTVTLWSANQNSTAPAYLTLKADGSLMLKTPVTDAFDLAGSAIVSISLTPNGYIKYASGLIVQWGEITATSATTSLQINFSISFSTSCKVLATPRTNTPSAVGNFSLGTFSLSSCYAYWTASNQIGVNWIAIGY